MSAVPDRPATTEFEFTAPLLRWELNRASYHVVMLPEDISDEIAALPLPPAGFGSVKVRPTVGSQTWSTSVFPSSRDGVYWMPVKKLVMQREGLEVGSPVTVRLAVVR